MPLINRCPGGGSATPYFNSNNITRTDVTLGNPIVIQCGPTVNPVMQVISYANNTYTVNLEDLDTDYSYIVSVTMYKENNTWKLTDATFVYYMSGSWYLDPNINVSNSDLQVSVSNTNSYTLTPGDGFSFIPNMSVRHYYVAL